MQLSERGTILMVEDDENHFVLIEVAARWGVNKASALRYLPDTEELQ
jgi:hypothetical protein